MSNTLIEKFGEPEYVGKICVRGGVTLDYNPGPELLKYRVVVLPDPIDKMTPGGLLEKAPEAVEHEVRMQTRGVLIDFSEMAFEDYKCNLPSKLNKVEYARYSGQPLVGDDGREYLIMNDADIVAFWR